MTEKYWQTKPLNELTESEWESLCDGCGRCCLHKLEDEGTGDVYYTRIACKLLDLNTCQCSNYSERHQHVPDCIKLDKTTARTFDWLPDTCAYRLRANNQPLPWWHPLESGSKETVHEAQISIKRYAVSEETVHVDDFESFIQDEQ